MGWGGCNGDDGWGSNGVGRDEFWGAEGEGERERRRKRNERGGNEVE